MTFIFCVPETVLLAVTFYEDFFYDHFEIIKKNLRVKQHVFRKDIS